MSSPKIVKKRNLTYVLYKNRVIVGVGNGQWVSYNQYGNYNRHGITKFRKSIIESGEDEYSTPADQMSLAYECGIKGVGVRAPEGF